MNREIKFRAWDNNSKEWLMGYEYPNLGGFSMYGECMLFNEWSGILNRFILQQKDRREDDLRLMQFTGLLDKNGKEIYEGDIVRGNHVDLFIIEGINGGLQMYNSNYYGQKHNELISEATCDAQTASWLKNSTVIGNIYQNPELLESVQK